MKNWALFIVCSLVVGFLNERIKLNINFFIEVTATEEWKTADIIQRENILHFQREEQKASYYHQIFDSHWVLEIPDSYWIYLKWCAPMFFTAIFFVLELIFLKRLFPSYAIGKRYIFYYYAAIIFAVLTFFLLFQYSGIQGFQVIARKMWILLQGPSLFVLIWLHQFIKKNGSLQY